MVRNSPMKHHSNYKEGIIVIHIFTAINSIRSQCKLSFIKNPTVFHSSVVQMLVDCCNDEYPKLFFDRLIKNDLHHIISFMNDLNRLV